jgi:uncharacterized membrane protein YuzA (DUF378 family)
MTALSAVTRLLIIVGGLNWGLVAIAKFDLVAWICGGLDFGDTYVASRIIYGVVGLAALYQLAELVARLRSDRPRVGERVHA